MAAQAAPAPTRTALLDVSFIFKNHHRFRALMEEMRGQVQAAEVQVQAEKKQITKMAKTLQSYNKGSPEYKELDERINEQSTRLQITVNKQKAEFLKQECAHLLQRLPGNLPGDRLLLPAIQLRLGDQIHSDNASPDNPELVLNMINKPVVWQRGLDITQNILDNLNRGARPIRPRPTSGERRCRGRPQIPTATCRA